MGNNKNKKYIEDNKNYVENNKKQIKYTGKIGKEKIIKGLIFLLLTFLTFTACEREEHAKIKESTKTKIENKSNIKIESFQTFEVEVPSDWIGRGNTAQFYSNNDFEDMYIIINSADNYEEDIAKTLALFLSTEFFEEKITFSCSGEELIKGNLLNERKDEKWFIYGYVIKSPKAYIICVSKTNNKEVWRIVDEIFASFKPLK